MTSGPTAYLCKPSAALDRGARRCIDRSISGVFGYARSHRFAAPSRSWVLAGLKTHLPLETGSVGNPNRIATVPSLALEAVMYPPSSLTTRWHSGKPRPHRRAPWSVVRAVSPRPTRWASASATLLPEFVPVRLDDRFHRAAATPTSGRRVTPAIRIRQHPAAPPEHRCARCRSSCPLLHICGRPPLRPLTRPFPHHPGRTRRKSSRQ